MASEKITSLFLFSILFNLFFSVYGYAFTVFPEDPGEVPDLDISLDIDDLYEIGISYNNATSLNITYGSAPTLVDEASGVPLRADWSSHLDGDYFQLQIQNPVERFLNTWILPFPLDLYMGPEYDHESFLYNSSIVNYFEPDYGWVRGTGGSNFAFFLSPIPPDEDNITKAVYETGILTLTFGDPIATEELSFRNFVRWYYSTLIGASSYGLPVSLVWIMRIVFSLNIIAGIFMLKELISL